MSKIIILLTVLCVITVGVYFSFFQKQASQTSSNTVISSGSENVPPAENPNKRTFLKVPPPEEERDRWEEEFLNTAPEGFSPEQLKDLEKEIEHQNSNLKELEEQFRRQQNNK